MYIYKCVIESALAVALAAYMFFIEDFSSEKFTCGSGEYMQSIYRQVCIIN